MSTQQHKFRVLYTNLIQSPLSISQLGILPIQKHIDPDCVLVLLVDSQALPTGIQLIDTWNFTYCTKIPFVTLPEENTAPIIEKPTYDLLIGRQGFVKIDESPMAGILPDDKWLDTIYAYIENTFHGPYLELLATDIRHDWQRWSTTIPSTVDILEGLSEDYLHDETIHEILYRIRQTSSTHYYSAWMMGDAINELQAHGLGRDESYFTAIQHIVGATDSRWPQKMSAVARAFPKRHRDPARTWRSYYKEYLVISKEQRKRRKTKWQKILEIGREVEDITGPFIRERSSDKKGKDDGLVE